MLDRTDKAAKPPKTDNWSALENERQGETVMLLVSGIVEVGSTNLEPRLSEASDGGGATLNLDLTIETADHEGADVLVWKQANFSKRVGDNEYRDVHIRWDGKVIDRCKVIDDDEAHARLTLHTDAANLKARVKSVPGKAKKAAAKAKDVVEAIGKAIGGRAVGTAVVAAAGTAAVAGVASRLIGKKAKKKTGKKAAKKTAKTTAKTKSKSKVKAKAATKAKAKSKTKTKVKAKTKKTKSKKAAPKKSAKRATKKTRTAKKSRRVAKKRGTKK